MLLLYIFQSWHLHLEFEGGQHVFQRYGSLLVNTSGGYVDASLLSFGDADYAELNKNNIGSSFLHSNSINSVRRFFTT